MDTHKTFIQQAREHKATTLAAGVIAAIIVGSGVYYYLGTRAPRAVSLPQEQTEAQTITANGTVEPAENPNLLFDASGRVASVRVKVGDTVEAGEVLASLDTANLSAQLSGAQATLKAQQAKLDELKAGPRESDLQLKETAVAQAKQTLASTYVALPLTLSDSYSKAYQDVHTYTDSLFSNPDSATPSLAANTTNSASAHKAENDRVLAGGELVKWQSELQAITSATSNDALNASLDTSLAHLIVIRTFEEDLTSALTSAVPSQNMSADQISAALASVEKARTETSAQILALTSAKQTISAQVLAIESAQNALDQLKAGASSQDIEAQQATVDAAAASVANIQAMISKNLIIAPFNGTVASVSLKAGQIANSDTAAITLLPKGAFQVPLYLTQIDVTRVRVGDEANVTLDAYGDSVVFKASVSAVDSAPSDHNGVQAYKVTLVFSDEDSRIKSGMTANATLIASSTTTQSQ